jgi:hypothetical protein
MKCPLCGCKSFYFKDPDDEFEIYPFDVKDNHIVFTPEIDPTGIPLLTDQTETYCNQCAWHGLLPSTQKKEQNK